MYGTLKGRSQIAQCIYHTQYQPHDGMADWHSCLPGTAQYMQNDHMASYISHTKVVGTLEFDLITKWTTLTWQNIITRRIAARRGRTCVYITRIQFTCKSTWQSSIIFYPRESTQMVWLGTFTRLSHAIQVSKSSASTARTTAATKLTNMESIIHWFLLKKGMVLGLPLASN